MDDIVKQAIAKWPNVPHCYGWLALDARGAWRMRDERTQQQDLPGDKIRHPALLDFIRRNYAADENGCWFFQNGPQRVYVNLELTPYIARSDPQHGFITHTGTALTQIDGAWLCETGVLILQSGAIVAALDDRDIGQCLEQLRIEDRAVSDDQLLAWLAQDSATAPLMLLHAGRQYPLQHLRQADIASRLGFVSAPQSSV